MKTLELTIKALISVSDEDSKRFVESPTGYLMVGDEMLGMEGLTVGVMNGPKVEPGDMQIAVREVVSAA